MLLEADCTEGDRSGIMGTSNGTDEFICWGIPWATLVGNTKAMSPLGNLVGTSWTPVPLPLLNMMPLLCGTTWGSGLLGSMCTCTCGTSCGLPPWLRQLARCWSSRRFTMGSRPGKRPTSLAHSLKPARNLLTTDGSAEADIATCCRCRFCRCFTVISRMSAFSNLEWRAGCNNNNNKLDVRQFVTKHKLKRSTYVFFHGVQDEGFELVQTVVDPGPAPLLHDGLVALQRERSV